MNDERDAAPASGVAALEHLTGPSRGKVMWLSASTLNLCLSPDRTIHMAEARPGDSQNQLVARLHRAGDTYEIEAPEGQPVWVNGARVSAQRLKQGDMIEFGEIGPLSRYCLYPADMPVRKTVGDILTDTLSYLRVSRQPVTNRIYRALCALLRRLTRETTYLFRISVTLAILVLTVLVFQQIRLSTRLQEGLESGAAQLESFAGALVRAREEALTPSDLHALRLDLERGVTSNTERLAALEQQSRAGMRIIAESMSSVVFVQGAYGFRERSSGRMLRRAVDVDGRPLITPMGEPLITLEGDGPVAERQFTGTGFAVGHAGALITNRHVALPWEDDATVEALAGRGLEPTMTRFIAYLPGQAQAVPVELLRASENADLAVLKATDPTASIQGLPLADAVPAVGEEVIVMGYPTGLRSMLAQSGDAFVEELQRSEDTDFWSVAARLAKAGHIAPLASRGIVGQVTAATIVYDAETTHGGSGGPVLNIEGMVVAVNGAILPEFGGSNLGVPAAKVRALLDEAGLASDIRPKGD